jgi:hypothetical protein
MLHADFTKEIAGTQGAFWLAAGDNLDLTVDQDKECVIALTLTDQCLPRWEAELVEVARQQLSVVRIETSKKGYRLECFRSRGGHPDLLGKARVCAAQYATTVKSYSAGTSDMPTHPGRSPWLVCGAILAVVRTTLREGLRGAAVLAACVVVLAVLGLSPSLAWIPEVPLLATAVVVPVAVLGLTGYRAAQRDPRVLAGAIAGGLAGAISGAVGGVAYVAFGKPLLNLPVGVVVGLVGGATIGLLPILVLRARR